MKRNNKADTLSVEETETGTPTRVLDNILVQNSLSDFIISLMKQRFRPRGITTYIMLAHSLHE